MTMKVGVYAAHDDDSILEAGGRIIQHLQAGDEVYIVIFSDGRNSHKAVLGITENPSIWEVKEKRAEEIKKAVEILGISRERLYFLGLIDGEGEIWQDMGVKNQVTEITKKEKPDLVYFHFPDAHSDHRAVSKIMLEVLKDLEKKPEAYQFFLWAFEGILAKPVVKQLVKLILARAHPEIDVNQIPEIPREAIRINVKRELELKRAAISEFKSQISVHPYPHWQVQKKPILEKRLIDHCLRGEEVFVKAL